MGVIFDEVVTEIEPTAGPAGAAAASTPDADSGEAAPSEQELARQIARLYERNQRLMAD